MTFYSSQNKPSNRFQSPLYQPIVCASTTTLILELLFSLSSFTTQILGLTRDESDDILRYLFRHISENHDLQVIRDTVL
jgi:hypothetical protein